MKRSYIAFIAVGAVLLLVGWNALVLSPRSQQRNETKEKVAAARATGVQFEADLQSLRAAAADQAARQDQIARIDRLVPPGDDLAGFIRALDDVSLKSQVALATLNPAAPAAGSGGTSSIGVSITLSGTFFQILDYLHRVETLERLVVLDSVRLAASPTAGGSPVLKANLEGRIFMAAAVAPVEGAQ